MSNIPLPDPLDLADKENASENWKLFKIQWNNYITLAEGFRPKSQPANLSAKVRLALFQSVIGGQALKVINKICEPQATIQTIFERLDKYFLDSCNVTYERFVFNSATQNSNESCKEFINRLHEQASKCNFSALADLSKLELEENLICDRLVAGLSDSRLKKRLLATKKLSLAQATDICTTEEQAESLTNKISEIVETQKTPPNSSFAIQNSYRKNCRYCGTEHQKGVRNCPAYGKVCTKCKKRNHFSRVCLQRKEAIKEMSGEASQVLNSDDDDEVFEMHNRLQKKRFYVNLLVPRKGGKKILKCQLDSGATCNVIGYDELKKLFNSQDLGLEGSNTVLTFYGGESQASLGKSKIKIKWKNKSYKMEFEVIRTQHSPLIGAQDCLRLGLIELDSEVFQVKNSKDPNEIFKAFPDVSTGLGCFKGAYHFKVDESVAPIVIPPRRYPLALREDIIKEIQRLEKIGVIKKMTEPSDWVSAMVVVKKPNKLRICLDPHQLNKAIQRSHYQSPTVEELVPHLTKARVFSILDLKDGFWHVKLTEESSKYTTFWTPLGRYRWLRLPFGIRSAPEEFQRRVHEVLEDLKGVAGIADDVLVWGCGETDKEALDDHNRNLLELLKRANENNIKFNSNKCKLGLSEVKYMGHIIGKDGLKPDPSKVEAIQKMEKPKNKDEARRFLGFINYLSKFVPHLSDIAAPIRSLLKEEAEWTWQKSHEDSFRKLIELVSAAPTLKFYDQKEQVVLQCDASQFGLGASLMQGGRPVAYISRTLTSTESMYAQIEKECLAVLFAFERFEQYLFGRTNIIVESDHKPLETIFKKPLTNAPKRLQRMLLRLQKFSFSVVYKPGRNMYIADFLSRAPVTNTLHHDNRDVLIFTAAEMKTKECLEECKAFDHLKVSDERLTAVKEETDKDRDLCKLKEIILHGWPDKKNKIPPDLRMYWNFRDELGVEEGVVLKGEKIVVPPSMRKELLEKIHSAHQGVEACLRRAKDAFFWIGMTKELKEFIERCDVCKKYAPAQQKQPLLLQETPERPWQRVAIDFAQDGPNHYIIMSDYYSSYFELKKTRSCTTEALIEFCKEQFARQGVPDVVVSDHGTPQVSHRFQEFSRAWRFKLILSSPYHHQANGKAESAVKILKTLLKRVKDGSGDFYQALLEWRNTPLQNIGYSPTQLLMSRRTKSFLPMNKDLLLPRVPCQVVERWNKKKEAYKAAYDKGARELPSLTVGQNVWVQRNPQNQSDTWAKGKVARQDGIRRYAVEVDGKLYLRNRRFIRI